MGTIASLIVVIGIIAVIWWFLKKVLHVGFIVLIGIVLVGAWWYFFVR